MSLQHVWLQMCDGGLVRADRISEIVVRPAPAASGGRPRWLIDVVVPTPSGAGDRHGWHTGSLHRTLAQSQDEPPDAPVALARLLAQLDELDVAGVVSTRADDGPASTRFVVTSFRTGACPPAEHPDTAAVQAGDVRPDGLPRPAVVH
ncbi:hypothetical protein PSU4_37770 [Pseudonocardia sulfidoxydans NBRC 16205]|uniref:Uncharacterized protein n=1 Tax=Pseudonocardia sulfidoxydans NBRC 16205 TaxID=1223511 RepID=A0A511DKL1_9PSEU|nr:hypothetical protein [Pseudonocardia sulfidoxydans]GEL24823.1 hypothetical protein PSU4_37770 [Pseudonocardia sulfidoxydans NBRC 16205]